MTHLSLLIHVFFVSFIQLRLIIINLIMSLVVCGLLPYVPVCLITPFTSILTVISPVAGSSSPRRKVTLLQGRASSISFPQTFLHHLRILLPMSTCRCTSGFGFALEKRKRAIGQLDEFSLRSDWTTHCMTSVFEAY